MNNYKLARQGGFKYANTELGRLSPYASIYELKTGNRYPWLGASSTGLGVTPTKNQLGVVSKFGRKRRRRKSTPKKKKHVGYTLKKGRVVKVYKIAGLKGRRYSNRNKLPKGKRVYKNKSQVPKNKKPITRRRTSKTQRKRRSRKRRERILWDIYDNTQSLSGSRYERTGRRTTPCYKRHIEGDCWANPNCEWTGISCRKNTGGSRSGPMKPIDYLTFGSGMINPTVGANYSLMQYATNSATPTLTKMEEIAGFPAYPVPQVTQMKNYSTYETMNNTTGMGF